MLCRSTLCSLWLYWELRALISLRDRSRLVPAFVTGDSVHPPLSVSPQGGGRAVTAWGCQQCARCCVKGRRELLGA